MAQDLSAGAPQPEADDLHQWSDARLLGFTPMDHVHEEFYGVTNALLASDAATVAQALAAFEAHAVDHFGQEDRWMTETGFPPRDCHMDEHAAVLKSVAEVREAIATGEAGVDLAHDLAEHLLDWFPAHADYLDAALAAWMCKQAFGGKPVVVRRRS